MEKIEDDFLQIAALERWLVRELVQRELEPFLAGSQAPNSYLNPTQTGDLINQLLATFLDFPPFRGSSDVEHAVKEVFAVLPKLDASMRSKGGNGLKPYLGSVISGPILSAARITKTSSDLVEPKRPAYYAAALLDELNRETNGLHNILEEVKCAHTPFELRPSAKRWYDAVRSEFVSHLLKLCTPELSLSKLKVIYSRIPTTALMLMLKSHKANSAIQSSIRLLFSRPFGGSSILQKVTADVLEYDIICQELELLGATFSRTRKSVLDKFFDEEYSSFAENLAQKEVENSGRLISKEIFAERMKLCVESYLKLASCGSDQFLDNQDSLRAIRYLDMLNQKVACDQMLDLLCDNGLIEAVTKLASVMHQTFAESVFARGSGLVKLAEDFFACTEAVLGKTSVEENRLQAIPNLVERALFRILALVHNVLLTDKTRRLHETAEWMFGLYQNAAGLRLPTERLLHELRTKSAEDYAQIMVEADRAYRRECANLNRDTFIRESRPRLETTAMILLPKFKEAIGHRFLPRLQKPPLDKTSVKEIWDENNLFGSERGGVRHLEVTFQHSERDTWSNLSKRRYICCGRTKSTSIWARYEANVPTGVHSPPPIVEVRLSRSDTGSGANPDTDWVLVPKNLNKSSLLSRLFLWFRRASNSGECASSIQGIEILSKDVDERKKEALLSCGYRVVFEFETGLFHQSHIWILGGLNDSAPVSK
jgi:hypothetical protein